MLCALNAITNSIVPLCYIKINDIINIKEIKKDQEMYVVNLCIYIAF